MKPIVSVIMPAYNSAAFIADAIESVLAQTMSDFHLIVVDDGSEDNTAAVVRGYLCDPRVTLLSQPNAGPSAARNRGIAACDSPFIALIDSDDRYEPNYLERMVGRLEADPGLAFCCCDAFLFGDTEVQGRRVNGGKALAPLKLETVLSRDFQVHGSTTMRRRWFERVGGFNPQRKSAEDLDMWVRMLCEGARAAYIDQGLIWYRRRADSLSTETDLLHESEIAMYGEVLERRLGPEIDAICHRRMARSRHHRAVSNAKAALNARQYREFLRAAGEAQRHGFNPKLAAASAVIGGMIGLSDGIAACNPRRALERLSAALPAIPRRIATGQKTRLAAIGLTSALALGSCGYEVTQGAATVPVTAIDSNLSR